MISSRKLLLTLILGALAASSHGVEISIVEHGGKRYVVGEVDLRRDLLQIFHRDETGRPWGNFYRLVSALEQRNEELLFAMNAGMFHPDLSAVGLLVADGKLQAPLNLAAGDGNFFLKPNGVFVVTAAGAAVVDSRKFHRQTVPVLLATQSGPLLMVNNRILPKFKPKSTSRYVRNAVGVRSPNVVLLVISEEPVNFHELASFFRDGLHCPNALYLDGGISSLWAPTLARRGGFSALGPIIGVTQPKRMSAEGAREPSKSESHP